jgi:hypothetical protein
VTRTQTLQRVEQALTGRPLIWFGTRGDDISALSDIASLSHSFSIISAYDGRPDVRGVALETYSGMRVDLDTYDIDDDPFLEPIKAFRRELLEATRRDCAVFTYRPSMFLSAITFARAASVLYLGMFKDHHAAFEHKPWVESAVLAQGIPCISWDYVSDEEKGAVIDRLGHESVVVRRSRTSGGVGIRRVDEPADLDQLWPREREAFVSVARFVDGGIPVNISAVVWDDAVTVHFPSVQLIGVPELTDRDFGYCGNDFGAMADIEPDVLDQMEDSTERIGRWLHVLGYRGAFGVDFLVADGVPLFTEINPRFQGSTRLSASISRELGESCLLLDHVAALLHLEPNKRPPLREQVAACPPYSQIVVHNGPVRRQGLDGVSIAEALAGVDGFDSADVLMPPSLLAEPGSALARIAFRRRITTTGYSVHSEVARSIPSNHIQVLTRSKVSR